MSKKDFVAQRSWLFETKQDFARRWNIDIYDNGFYVRCKNIVATIISDITRNEQKFERLSYEAHSLVAEPYSQTYTHNSFQSIVSGKDTKFNFSQTDLYKTLQILSNDNHFFNFLQILEHILNAYRNEKDEKIILEFNDIALISNKNVRLFYNNGKYEFYPSGVELFDEKLVNDILEFLQSYPKAHKELSEALQEFLKKSYRDAVDKTRLALEIFLKELLNNDKSLENQKDELCRYFGNKIHTNIKSMFLNILDLYAKFNNDKAKHNSGSFNEYEVEFLFYLVGNFIRLFMQIKNNQKHNPTKL